MSSSSLRSRSDGAQPRSRSAWTARFFHAARAAHGAVYFKSLDDAAFFAVSSLVEDNFVLTSSFNLYMLAPVSAGVIRCVGTVVRGSGSSFLAESVLYNEQDEEIARGSGMFVKSKIRLAPRWAIAEASADGRQFNKIIQGVYPCREK